MQRYWDDEISTVHQVFVVLPAMHLDQGHVFFFLYATDSFSCGRHDYYALHAHTYK